MKKSYKWIIMFFVVAAVCIAGGIVRDKYDNSALIDGVTPVDYNSFNVEDEISKADENREQYVIMVNINKASVEELMILPKIGRSAAEKIIEYRNSYGDFINIDEIKSVEGIGEKTFDAIREFIVVE